MLWRRSGVAVRLGSGRVLFEMYAAAFATCLVSAWEGCASCLVSGSMVYTVLGVGLVCVVWSSVYPDRCSLSVLSQTCRSLPAVRAVRVETFCWKSYPKVRPGACMALSGVRVSGSVLTALRLRVQTKPCNLNPSNPLIGSPEPKAEDAELRTLEFKNSAPKARAP